MWKRALAVSCAVVVALSPSVSVVAQVSQAQPLLGTEVGCACPAITPTAGVPVASIPPVAALELISEKTGEEYISEQFQGPNGVMVAEKFQGKIARDYYARKALANVGTLLGRRRAEAQLRSRGFKQTDTVAVSRTFRKDFVRVRLTPTLPQESQSNGQGEIIFWSWDDGDDSTWEGVWYAEEYSTGNWTTGSMQVDISSPSNADVEWYHHEGDSIADGGEGGGPLEVAYRGGEAFLAPRIILASSGPVAAEVEETWTTAFLLQEHENQEDADLAARAFFRCQVEVIIGCALFCWWTGPLYFVCGFACHSAGSVIDCVLREVFWEWWWS